MKEVRFLCAGVFGVGGALLLQGCAGLSDSLKMQTGVLVKVPETEIHGPATAAGWHFRHMLEGPPDVRHGGQWQRRHGQWYIVWNNDKPIRTGLWTPYWRSLLALTPEIADATHAALGAYPVLLEPDRTFRTKAAKAPPEPDRKEAEKIEAGGVHRVVAGALPTGAWPGVRRRDPADPRRFIIDPLWHLGDGYSELARARAAAGLPGKGGRIRVGHLDNGLDGAHAGAPEHLARGDWRANAVGLHEYEVDLSKKAEGRPEPKGGWRLEPRPPEQTKGAHGMGTVGLGFGGLVEMPDQPVRGGKIAGFKGCLGGAPQAEVVPVRVAPWVFSFSTGEMAYAIDYASRMKRCDVLTMSHGGAPTQAWVDAVNAAYERGTAMFAAESDFFSLNFDPLPPRGLLLPTSPVYPAAFRRVVGVTGVTADGGSYARNSFWRLLRAPQDIGAWVMRGSYGADGTSTVAYRRDETPDASQGYRQGGLRPHPIAAYSPNVPWLAVRKKDGREIADGVDFNGAGTSAATPQVAAAAALWLQKHRGEFTPEEWRGWQKSEAVYYALLKSADRTATQGQPDKYLGSGLLKANGALAISYAEAQRARRPAGKEWPAPGTLYFAKTQDDFFEGDRSLWSFFGLSRAGTVNVRERAVLEQSRIDGRAAALEQLYRNTLLLREWHGGDIPREGAEMDDIKRQARARAAAAPLPPVRR